MKASGFKYLAKTFTLPDVHPGSIIEYRYREQGDPHYYVNESWTITSHLYTRDAHFTIRPDTGVLRCPLYLSPVRAARRDRSEKQTNGTYTLDIHDLPGLGTKTTCHRSACCRRTWTSIYLNPSEPQNETPDKFWNRKGKAWSDDVDHFVNKKSALEKRIWRTIVSADDSPEVKLRKIYARVQKIRNLSMEDAKSEKEAKAGTAEAQ